MTLKRYGTSTILRFTLRQADSNIFATSSHWEPAEGDVKLSEDGGVLVNATNLPTFANGQWSLLLTAEEMGAAEVCVIIDDAAIIPESFYLETFGDPEAKYPSQYGLKYLGIDHLIVDGGVPTPIHPVGEGGMVTLYVGNDYTPEAAGYVVIPIPSNVQDRAPASGQTIFFQGLHQSSGVHFFESEGIIIDRVGEPGMKDARITISRLDMQSIEQIDENWVYFVGDRPTVGQDGFMTGKLVLRRGPVYAS